MDLAALAASSMEEGYEILVLTNDDDKECGRCHKHKPLSHFSRCESNEDKLQSWCKKCQSEYKKERRMIARLNTNGMLDMTVKSIFSKVNEMDRKQRNDTYKLFVKLAERMKVR